MTTTKLDAFTRAYVECALWSSTDDDGMPLDKLYTVNDIDPATLAEMIADCDAFQDDHAEDIAAEDSDRAGYDFWLTRNRHGAGFWDRGLPGDVGRRLTEAAHAYGEYNLIVGDDGMIYGG